MDRTSDEKPSTEGNRRRANRHRLNISATLREPAGGERPVTITQLSVGGFAMRSAVQLAIGAVYTVESFDSLITPGVKVRVVTERPLGDTFDIGAQIIDEPKSTIH